MCGWELPPEGQWAPPATLTRSLWARDCKPKINDIDRDQVHMTVCSMVCVCASATFTAQILREQTDRCHSVCMCVRLSRTAGVSVCVLPNVLDYVKLGPLESIRRSRVRTRPWMAPAPTKGLDDPGTRDTATYPCADTITPGVDANAMDCAVHHLGDGSWRICTSTGVSLVVPCRPPCACQCTTWEVLQPFIVAVTCAHDLLRD